MKIRYQYVIILSIITIIITLLFSFLRYRSQKSLILENVDQKIFTAAVAAREILGDDYHDRITDISSVEDEEYRQTIKTFNSLCMELGLNYLWSLMVLEDQIVFTSATAADKDGAGVDYASFLEVHTNPGAYRETLESMKITYSTFHDKWGDGRMVLLPGQDSLGRPHLYAASMPLDRIDEMVWAVVLTSFSIGIAAFIICFLAGFFLTRSISHSLIELSHAAKRIAEGGTVSFEWSGRGAELQSLASSISRMNKDIAGKMLELRASREFLESLVDAIPYPLFLKDEQYRMVMVNRAECCSLPASVTQPCQKEMVKPDSGFDHFV
jgi:methyl-accepting chemotaxis protein